MVRFCAIVIAILFIVSLIPTDAVYAGWKENYREKYSKKQLDPNSAKAQSNKRLANMDFTFKKWTHTPEERKAMGMPEPKRRMSEHIMPGKRKGEVSDKYEGSATNFSPANTGMAEEEGGTKSGYTLTGVIKSLGEKVGVEPSQTSAPPIK